MARVASSTTTKNLNLVIRDSPKFAFSAGLLSNHILHCRSKCPILVYNYYKAPIVVYLEATAPGQRGLGVCHQKKTKYKSETGQQALDSFFTCFHISYSKNSKRLYTYTIETKEKGFVEGHKGE